MRYTPNPAEAARRLAGDLAMRLQTPLLPDDPEERLDVECPTGGLSHGEQQLLLICDHVHHIGLHVMVLDADLRRSVASTLRRLAEVVEP